MQSLEIISVNIWQILISLCNLLLLFLILKKFLYKPVRETLQKRQDMFDEKYRAAKDAERHAWAKHREYEEKLTHAQADADALMAKATQSAGRRSDEIVSEAKEKAESMVRRAQNEIALERKRAESEMKDEIADVSALLAEKLLGRNMEDADQHRLIQDFLEELSDQNERNE